MISITVIHLLLLLVAFSSLTATNFEQFGLKLYSTVSQNKKNENIFLSPASISLAMSMCTVGAQQETLNQMLKTFEVSSRKELIKTAEQIMHIFSIANQDKQVQLKLANRLYAQKAYQLQEEYLKIVQNSFKADIKLEDFENKDVSPETRLIIINSIYFKGTWIKEFNKNLTNENADFHETNDKISKVALMHQREKFAYAEDNDLHVQIIHVPYKSENKDIEFVFTVILPNRGVQLDVVEQKLASQPDSMQKLLSHQNTRTEELHLYLPKFKMEATFELSDILQQLGMKDAFSSYKANFTGSEAAAATAVIIGIYASINPPPQPIEFKADRPFLFFIRESRQNIVLFSGRFISPPTNS
ncbi:unnamed protein product [Rotaria sordida]|uniref:Serpin domain-containing protein n=1 Tax=Rotaria sordida TaxID=392033 RepID=A0A815CUN3_9BILA|nr:unnamed protein product [Rotaria sordida]